MPLTQGCLPACDPSPPPVCPPVNGTSPDLLGGTLVSSIDLNGVVAGTPIRALMSDSGNSAIIVSTSGVVSKFDGFGGLVQNLTLTVSVNLDGVFPSVGFVTIQGASISQDGTKLYTIGSSTVLGSQVIIQWNMATPFDPATITSVDTFTLPVLPGTPFGVVLDGDGVMLTRNSGALGAIRQYSLADPLLVSTAVFTNEFFPFAINCRDMTYNTSRSTLMFTRSGGGAGNDALIIRHNLPTPGSVAGAVVSISAQYGDIINLTSVSSMSLLIPNQTQLYFMGTNRFLEQVSLLP